MSRGIDQRREAWQNLLRAWGVDPTQADRKFAEISRSYVGPGRFYHTFDHVMDVLSTVESLASSAKNLNAVKLAAWLHDVIYDSRASDNEERSAEHAERLCEELSIPEGRLVASLIRKTKSHDAGEDADAQVLIDADLAILGASETVYRDFAEKIRREYGWVPAGKAASFGEFLDQAQDLSFSGPFGRTRPPKYRCGDCSAMMRQASPKFPCL